MSAHRPGSDIFGENETGDYDLDSWINGRKSDSKKREKSSQNNFASRSTPLAQQKATEMDTAPQSLSSKDELNIWDAQQRQKDAHTSTFPNTKATYVQQEPLYDGMQGGFHPSSLLSSRIENENSSSTAHEEFPTVPEMPFTAPTNMANPLHPSQPMPKVDVHDSFWQREAHWPQDQAASHNKQIKHVSFEHVDMDAAHSLNKSITQPAPMAVAPGSLNFNTSNSEREATMHAALKHMSDAQHASVSCLQDVQALVFQNQEACKQFANQVVDLKARIAFFETLCSEKEAQNKHKDDVLANKDAYIEKKDAQLAHKDEQLEAKDAQLAAKDDENVKKRQNLDEFRLTLEKAKDKCDNFVLDGKHIFKEWENLKVSVKADWQNLKKQLDDSTSLNKDLTDGIEKLKSKQDSFKNQLDDYIDKLAHTERELLESKEANHLLSLKIKAVSDDAHKAQQKFQHDLMEKDNEIQVADGERKNTVQELEQIKKEREAAMLSSSTKQNELITAENKIKQLQESHDKLVKKFKEFEKTANENKIRMEEKAEEFERKANESQLRVKEKAKVIDQMAKERNERTSEKERLEDELKSSREQVADYQKVKEELRTREEGLKAREEVLKAREEALKARGEGSSKVRKEAPEREPETVKGKSTTTQSNDDQKSSKSSSSSRKKPRVEIPSMDSE